MAHGRAGLIAAWVAALGLGAATAHAQFYDRPPARKPSSKSPASDRPVQPKKERRELDAFRDEADEVLGSLSNPAPEGGSVASDWWSIVIVAFVGDDAGARAEQGLHKVRVVGGLADAYLERRGAAVVIAYGRYDDASDARAADDLRRIQSMRIDNQTPFDGAILAPPSPERLSGSLPELDLRNAVALFGKERALYTLQVAIYGKPDRSAATPEEIAEFRHAAEDAAVILRREGELAFYYHAPERSTVTVGVFGQSDYDPVNTPGIESDPLRSARERHPLNLVNGQAIREKIHGVKENDPRAHRLQPSFLVAVPEK